LVHSLQHCSAPPQQLQVQQQQQLQHPAAACQARGVRFQEQLARQQQWTRRWQALGAQAQHRRPQLQQAQQRNRQQQQV
jgi:hypothetical protein